jgi:hypothetical protein
MNAPAFAGASFSFFLYRIRLAARFSASRRPSATQKNGITMTEHVAYIED